ncbi:UDP-glucose 4-epimerase GalE [Candidatus Babeliales bacterium]|nr:UDP-glucose 4-epimerase GalE [Candidatus Babeliales bacterium]
MKKTVLVTGGAGYIGSHTAYLLAQQGYDVIIIDKLLHNQPFNHNWCTLIKEDFANKDVLKDIFKSYNVDSVVHFAAFIEVGESVIYPQRFYENNVLKTFELLDSMLTHGVKKFIYSSSCAVYGNPIKIPMDENHPKNPVSPYGKNKLAVEFILEDYSKAYDLKYIALRYFNAAGAFPEAGLGEMHNPETHIIPLLLRAILSQKPFKIFGDNYNSKDGTCIRDYVHVRDISDAHVKALDHLEKTGASDFFNLGTGTGYTVKELINSAEKICAAKANLIYAERRDGDVDALVADLSKASDILNWKPAFSNLEFILKSALRWEEKVSLEKNEIITSV